MDNDGMGTNFENTFGLNPTNPADADLDLDSDGATNLEEFKAGRNPSVNEGALIAIINSLLLEPPELDTDNDGIADSSDPDDDNDGIPDSYENANGLNPLDAGDAGQDLDADGISNLQEFQLGTSANTNDTDNDGLPDRYEVENGFNPLVSEDAALDDDGDGLTNLQEFQLGRNPLVNEGAVISISNSLLLDE